MFVLIKYYFKDSNEPELYVTSKEDWENQELDPSVTKVEVVMEMTKEVAANLFEQLNTLELY